MALPPDIVRLLQEFASVIELEVVTYREAMLLNNPPDIFLTLEPTYIADRPDEPLLSLMQTNGVEYLRPALRAGYVPHLGWYTQFDEHPLKQRLSDELAALINNYYSSTAECEPYLAESVNESLGRYIYQTLREYHAMLFRRVPFSREHAFALAINQLDARINPERASHFSGCYLYNFELAPPDAAPVRFDDNLEIRLSTRDDLKRQLSSSSMKGNYISPYMLIHRHIPDIPIWNVLDSVMYMDEERINDAITALRLYQSAYIGRGQVLTWESGLITGHGEGVLLLDHLTAAIIVGRVPVIPKYQLQVFEVEEVVKIYQRLRHPGEHTKLNIAITRFNDSYRRPDARERIIDLVIALENLFGEETVGQTTEVGYRLRMRAAKYLGEDAPQRKDLVRFISILYELRSSIVHGDSEGVERIATKRLKKSLDDVVKDTENLVRRALLKMLANPLHKEPQYLNNLLLDTVD
ncbi:MAG TPA: hypothetical protein VGX92_08170 [Pyrinomonadaceae bacterium]|jgi:hypothetical protein|nr:hypothetical protein [Pyrinomonadaceae bacterium]